MLIREHWNWLILISFDLVTRGCHKAASLSRYFPIHYALTYF